MPRKFIATQAEREKLKFVAMFTGADGSGKTVGALMIAKGLIEEKYTDMDNASDEFWAKIGVLDTEHNRSKVNANQTINGHFIGKFTHIDFEAPYDVESYIDGVNYLKSLGCEVIIIDSLSHAWDDTGGILELHNKLGGSFQTWQKVNPIIKKFYRAVTADQEAHIISSVRAKIKYDMSATETGALGVTKIGLKPIMRDNFEYEVMTTVHFNQAHKTTVLKDITHIFDNDVFLEPKAGRELHKFLDEGIDVNAIKLEERTNLIIAIKALLTEGEKPKFKKQVDSLMFTVKQQAKRKYSITNWIDLPTASLFGIKEGLEGVIKNGK